MPIPIGTAVLIKEPLSKKVGIVMDILPDEKYIIGRYFRYRDDVAIESLKKGLIAAYPISPESHIRDRLILMRADRSFLTPLGIKRRPVI